MPQLTRVVGLPFLVVSLWAQSLPAPDELDQVAIRLAKNAMTSTFDGSLPKVTLEFFLNYEAAGKLVRWNVTDCEEQSSRSKQAVFSTCVEASFDTKDGDITVLVSVRDVAAQRLTIPSLVSLAMTDAGGARRRLRRLGDLPMELHRPPRRPPHDLPDTVAVLTTPSSVNEKR